MRQALDGTGLSEEGSGPLTPADAARVYGGNARLAALLASDGLDSGWVSYQTASGHQLLTFVLQFDDPVHARHFEAQRTVDLCAIGQRAPFDAGVPGADGLWTKSGTAQSRVALLRGSRDYYIEELGASGHYPPELRAAVRAVAAAAR